MPNETITIEQLLIRVSGLDDRTIRALRNHPQGNGIQIDMSTPLRITDPVEIQDLIDALTAAQTFLAA